MRDAYDPLHYGVLSSDGNYLFSYKIPYYDSIVKYFILTTLDYIKSLITDDKPYYILLDEVQMLDAFVGVLNSLLRIDNVDVYVTGSNSKFLSKDIITEFRGRGDEVHVFPLTFKEFMQVMRGMSTTDGQNM